jgi:tetratricopeptide (TPR) repeat protein
MKSLTLLFVLSLLMISSCGQKPAEVPVNTEAANTLPATQEFTDAKAALDEGTRLLDENDYLGAISALQQATKLDPDLADAHFRLGVAYALQEMQQARSGEIIADPIVTNSNKDARIKPRSERSFERAIEAYKKHLKENPEDDLALFNLGRSYSKILKDEEAEEQLRKAVKLKPDDTEYQMELGAVLIRLAKYREAVIAIKRSLELDPDSERGADLLEEAEAGVKRVDFQMPKKDANVARDKGNANTSADEPVSGDERTAPAANSGPPANNRPNAPPANRPPANMRPMSQSAPAARPPAPATLKKGTLRR